MGCENMIPNGCAVKSPPSAQAPSHPLKEGRLRMVQTVGGITLSTPITLKIYASNYGMYAVVAQDKAICKECGFISLKNCIFKRHQTNNKLSRKEECGFQIIQTKKDLVPLTFLVSKHSELEDWESVITSGGCRGRLAPMEQPRTPLAPLCQPTRARTLSEPLPALVEEGGEE